jgi:archaellum component FlaC
MKKFFKKHYLLIPSFVVLIFLGTLFNSQHARFDSVASILTAQQLINNSNYESLSYAQKVDLIAKIDKELNLLALDYRDLNSELQSLKDQKESIQSEYNTANQKLTSINSQISAQVSRLESLKNRLQSLNENYREKSRQCNQLKAPQLQNCRNQLQNISQNINEVKNQITATQNSINSTRLSVSSAQMEVSVQSTELRNVSDDLKSKQIETDKVKQMITTLSRFRIDVVNSTSSKNEPNRKPGCTDVTATNWDSSATEDDGSCQYKGDARGCTDAGASNYDPEATEDDGSCYYSCSCEEITDPTTGEQKEVEKVTKLTAHITEFGGPDDEVMAPDEKLSVSGGYARDLNPDDIYTAWPMPDKEKSSNYGDDFKTPFGLPSVEKCFGPLTNSWPQGSGDERVAEANDELNNYYAKISYVGPDGVKRTVMAKIVDRGPEDRSRWDASRGLRKALGINKDQTVELEVSLVPKEEGGSCGQSS